MHNNFASLIKNTVSGESIAVYDVNSVEHNLNINLTSDTVTDFSDITVSRYGKNIFDIKQMKIGSMSKNLVIEENGFSFQRVITKATSYVAVTIRLEKGIYFLSGDVIQSDGLNGGWGVYDNQKGLYLVNSSSSGLVKERFTIEESKEYSINFYCNYNSVEDTQAEYKNIQLELASSATDFENYKPLQTVTANSDGSVKGITSISPNMTLFVDRDDVTINCEYNADTKRYIDNKIAELTQ